MGESKRNMLKEQRKRDSVCVCVLVYRFCYSFDNQNPKSVVNSHPGPRNIKCYLQRSFKFRVWVRFTLGVKVKARVRDSTISNGE